MSAATQLNRIPQLYVGRATGKTKWVFDVVHVISFARRCALKTLG